MDSMQHIANEHTGCDAFCIQRHYQILIRNERGIC